MKRLLSAPRLVVLFSVGLVAACLPEAAKAAGVPPRGTTIQQSKAVVGVTGSCVCSHVWYTVGLRRGPVRISTTVTRCSRSLTGSCGLRMFLLRGDEQVGMAQPMCSPNALPCRGAMSHRIGAGGVYYLLIEGQGSLAVTYSLQVRGNIYRLHCHKYC
jgi:hypothetical protein